MARVTVEDCIDKVDSPYELVMVAKERAAQLNSGLKSSNPKSSPKPTALSNPSKLTIKASSSGPSIVWSNAINSSSLNGLPSSFKMNVITPIGDSASESLALKTI